ncbi:MAG TPA: ABC transporter ATP-binding protein [Cellulomonas sp.]
MSADLRIAGVRKAFGGVQALDGVDLVVHEGEKVGIIGPNGSGKTTLFNVLTGVEKPDEGTIHLGDVELTGRPLHAMAALGVARTFQSLRLFGDLTARENVLAGAHHRMPRSLLSALVPTPAGHRRRVAERGQADELLDLVGLGHRKEHFAVNLSYGQMKRLELARALSGRPRLLLLDEPAAGMNDTGAGEICALISQVQAERGGTLVVIEHNVRVLLGLVDRVVVMDEGRVTFDGAPEDVQRDSRVVEAYFGMGTDA